MESDQSILFYGVKNLDTAYLSNFYVAPFTVSGVLYQTNQHFFQSKKFQGRPEEQQIIEADSPKKAKQLGRKLRMQRPQNWQEIKQNVMLYGLRAKFTQNENLKQKLLSTENHILREHTARDKYWGDGGKKFSGKNRLGVLLMQVRAQIRDTESQKNPKKHTNN